jgi:hypothetical protein
MVRGLSLAQNGQRPPAEGSQAARHGSSQFAWAAVTSKGPLDSGLGAFPDVTQTPAQRKSSLRQGEESSMYYHGWVGFIAVHAAITLE